MDFTVSWRGRIYTFQLDFRVFEGVENRRLVSHRAGRLSFTLDASGVEERALRLAKELISITMGDLDEVEAEDEDR